MTPFTKCALIILLTLTMCSLAQSYRLAVRNELGENMTIQCRSKDRDIGRKEISDQVWYMWDFELKYFEYWDCSIWWSQASAKFPVFRPGDAHEGRCAPYYCMWFARRDGIYLFITSTHTYEKKYLWPH
ncbi:Plant self-incompatibility S1 [Dillenia turbinata]|uniref:S-protein homolog n=1 Tax=Dillenia turbinata TaxID=194707 RepID=A0AAN8VDJ5_9MAGN